MSLTPRDKLASKIMFVALQQLAFFDEAVCIADLKKMVLSSAILSAKELEKTGSGKARWESALEWYSNEYVKAGFIIKQGRAGWQITQAGRDVLMEDAEGVFLMARRAYDDYQQKHGKRI